MDTQAFDKFETMDDVNLSIINGGKMGGDCLMVGASSLAAGAGALASSAVPAVSMYLGAQAITTGLTVYNCFK